MSDKFVDRFLGQENTEEALSWLKAGLDTDSHLLSEGWPTQESIDFIQRFYDAGAVEVLAVDIDQYEDGMENTGKLVIKLPEDPAKREAVLGLGGEIAMRNGFSQEPDQGQTYLFLMLD
ncbi:MAG: hypothetical protein R3C11_15985 [Planctomycetaceae bacterium]